jgi:elongation factor P
MALSTNDLKNGMVLNLEGDLMQVVEFQHVKPGKGPAFVRTTMRNLRTGANVAKTFSAGLKVEQAIVDRRNYQFLYREGSDYIFMDLDTYDQINLTQIQVGDASKYLKESDSATIHMYGLEPLLVELPASVELEITETEPGLQGDRVSGARKPATLETGLVVQVPIFVNLGDVIKVDTRNGEYITRV